jgi:CheY-like chemotaxis protein
MKDARQITILMAEDDDGHAELIREALEESGVNYPVKRFSNGLEVWNYLRDEKTQINNGMDLSFWLLLDMKMPYMDGVEVLKGVKEDPVLKKIPVVMITTTDDPREVGLCYALGCNLYITKPVDYNRFTNKFKCLGRFMQIVQL